MPSGAKGSKRTKAVPEERPDEPRPDGLGHIPEPRDCEALWDEREFLREEIEALAAEGDFEAVREGLRDAAGDLATVLVYYRCARQALPEEHRLEWSRAASALRAIVALSPLVALDLEIREKAGDLERLIARRQAELIVPFGEAETYHAARGREDQGLRLLYQLTYNRLAVAGITGEMRHGVAVQVFRRVGYETDSSKAKSTHSRYTHGRPRAALTDPSASDPLLLFRTLERAIRPTTRK